MTTTLIDNIGELTTNVARDGDPCGTLRDAAVLIEGSRIAWTGRAGQIDAVLSARGLPREPGHERTDARLEVARPDNGNHSRSRRPDEVSRGPNRLRRLEVVDAGGRAVIPGFVDSHTHLVFGGDRADEFEARMTGTPYAAGGIRRTVAATREASDEELRARLAAFVSELHRQGTTTFEIKTGYGLTVADEARLARLAAEVTPEVTFLGAHVVPAEYADRRDEYVDLVCGDMLRACAPHSRWVDVFCERGAFTAAESERVLVAGARHGLEPRVHGNQLGPGEGVRLAVAMDAASVDHCTFLSADDIAALAGSSTVATLLPGVEFSTRQPYPDARRLIDAGVTVALASDCNPGSSFTSSMPFMIALAVREMGMTPAEAVWAATAGGARALRRHDVGAIAPGAPADILLLDAPTRVHLAYRPGVPLIAGVYKSGARV
ncbi:imidazolonepropionase [Microbacterium yannicii]|uniref:imidazolonepropionase n=1 Tax=Microbacterium yannicii TaxID=671622 RepID=UPI0002EB1C2A|nr:imidazolonepropionase [Microbacterium yannicii]